MKIKKISTNKILEGDCIEKMKELPAKSIDLIFADPPYNFDNFNELIEQAISRLNDSGVFVLESSVQEYSISPYRVNEYGDSQLTFWKKN